MHNENRRLPAEWEPQSGVMLTWPHDRSDWLPFLATVEPVYVEIARAVCAREKLLICCRDETHVDHVRVLLQGGHVNLVRVTLMIAPSNDSWARDHGPITVFENNAPRLLDFTFNGWGKKYSADLDNLITRRLHDRGAFNSIALESFDFVLEGGGIESDGAGTLLTTAQCLLSPHRNPLLTRAQIERVLKDTLGVARVLWLEHGHLAGDDTDSHIDTLVRFCDAHTLAYMSCDDPSDEHYTDLRVMEDELRTLRDWNGKPYRLIALPLPRAQYNAEGRRLPATYANFLIINDAVLAPTYGDPADKLALERLRTAFPKHEIVAINCTPLIQQFGSLHCITMQLPHGVLPE